MKTLFHLLLPIVALIAVAPVSAEEKEAAPAQPARHVWVGFSVSPLAPEMRAHAPGLPEGIGFLVEKVFPGGPAAEAGVKPYDIVWMLDDQLLVNEAQFATLLRMYGKSDTVKLAVMRSGEKVTLELTLEEMPEMQLEAPVSPMDVTLVPPGVPGMPKTVVYPQSSVAEVSREDGSTARLTKEEEGFVVVIRDADAHVIYEGPVRGEGAAVPPAWRSSVEALIRGLNRTEDRPWSRRPRPRVVVPAARE